MRPHDATCPLSIRLFGAFEVCMGGRPIPPLKLRKSRALLALLVLRRGGEVERDYLSGLLWPDSARSPALHNLSNCLADLRRALGPEAGRLYSPSSHTLALDLTGAAVEVLAFDSILARGDGEPPGGRRALEEAVALHRGSLLEGCVEEWVFQERQAREQAVLAALERLATEAMASGDAAAAERYSRRAAEVDPLRECARRHLMLALAATGNYAAALLVYRELRLRLHRELNAEPDPKTQSLFQRLRQEARDKAAKCRSRCVGLTERGGATETIPPASPERPAPFSPPHASRRRLHNLPAPTTLLLGRDAAVAELAHWLRREEIRLVTLTGPGGSGKTRLGMQVAMELLGRFPEGAFLVELAPLREPQLVAATIAHVLGVRESEGQPLTESLKERLHDQQLLLVLDNFEHLLPAADLVAELLAAAPGLKVLVTSRAPLQLRGERQYPVPPLAVPEEGVGSRASGVGSGKEAPLGPCTRHPTPDTLTACPSVQLFLQRAQDIRPDFAFTAENAAAVAAICCRLEGLPLAIELAAVRVAALTPAQILARLDQRFELLVGHCRGTDSRHRSLRAALDWSYQLLSPELQRFFARLSIFRGGWALGAAAAILDFGFPISGCGGSGAAGAIQNPGTQRAPDMRKALDTLEELRQCSLVVAEAAGEEMQYRLLETLREYAAEQLSAEERSVLTQRHLDYYLALFDCGRQLPGKNRRTIQQHLDALEQEHDNVRVALDWWAQSGAAVDWMQRGRQPHGDLLELLARFWWVRGYAPEGLRRLAEILSLPGADLPSLPRAWLLCTAGRLAHQQGDFAAADALVQENVAIYEKLGAASEKVWPCGMLASVARAQGDYARARIFHEQALAIARETEDELEVAGALSGMGYTAYLAGDLETGEALLEESLQILRKGQEIAWASTHQGGAVFHAEGYREAVSHLGTLAWVCVHRGEVADARGEYETARANLEESLRLSRDLATPGWATHALHRLGQVAQHQGQWSAAAAHFAESLEFWRQDGNKPGIAACLEGLGAVAEGQGEPERAARLLGAAAALRESRSIPLPPVERANLERVIAGVRTSLREKVFAAAWAAGRTMPLDHAIAEAMQAVGVQS